MWHIRADTNASIIAEMFKQLKERNNDFSINIRTENRKITCSSNDEFVVSQGAILIGHYDNNDKIWSTIININKIESIDFMEI